MATTASTCTSRASVRPSSSRSDVFAGVLARGAVADQVSGHAWLQALLDFEAALARAQARERVISVEEAEAIVAACAIEHFDVDEIGAGAAEIGNPAGAVVTALKALTDAPVHHGATSQDAVDTAAMLVTKRALVPLLHDLRAAAGAAADLAKTHRDTPIIGRTLLQHALPTTFGLKAAGWMLSLDEAADALVRLPLTAQLGGPVGTVASVGRLLGAAQSGAGGAARSGGDDVRRGLAVVSHLARDLG